MYSDGLAAVRKNRHIYLYTSNPYGERIMTAVDIFKELVRLGFVTPKSEYPDLRMPTMYRSVQSITTTGTVESTPAKAADAKLELGPEGNSGD
jgi:hypothetical protein